MVHILCTLLTETCKDLQLRILNGRFLGDSLGYYTFYNSNGQSTVDYMLASQSVFYIVKYFIVHTPVEFSDHCMISVCIKSHVQRETTPTTNNTPLGHYIWDSKAVDFYKDALLENGSINDILYLNTLLDDNNLKDIDFLVSKTNDIYIKAASETMVYRKPSNLSRSYNKKKKAKPKKPWMSNDCLLLRREVRSLGKKLQKDPTNLWTRHTYTNCVREYNKLKKSLKKQFYHTFIDEINHIDPKNSKKYWQSLKK